MARRLDANAIAVARLSWRPKRHRSGEIDYTGRISKIGDGSLRTALYDAAHIILSKPSKGCSQLKSCSRAGTKGQGGARPPTEDDHASQACEGVLFNAV
ncbi:transposase [Bradyrhizobium sp. AS23.2]|uniref:transposase n=1 Tax=Bradyrhizobium sp. AS23.2 TaxID=1680155 RepID=UPI00093F4412|nr:transposase [Bradyrhizobium sp. AS23.2]